MFFECYEIILTDRRSKRKQTNFSQSKTFKPDIDPDDSHAKQKARDAGNQSRNPADEDCP